jgi:hypothetical protein
VNTPGRPMICLSPAAGHGGRSVAATVRCVDPEIGHNHIVAR